MSQQINLLRSAPSVSRFALVLAGVFGLTAIAAVLYGRSASSETALLREQVAASDARLEQLRGVMGKGPSRRDGDTAAAIQADIAALKPKAQAAKELIANVRQGQADGTRGLVQQLAMVAVVPREDVWITGVDVSQGGQSVVVTGQAMNNESVIRFSRAVSEAYQSLGVRFRTLEMSPVTGPRTGTSGPNAPPVVAFKLS